MEEIPIKVDDGRFGRITLLIDNQYTNTILVKFQVKVYLFQQKLLQCFFKTPIIYIDCDTKFENEKGNVF